MESERSNLKKKNKKEFSAGGVVMRPGASGPEVLLINPNSGDPGRGIKTVWSFPKGWIGDHGKETIEEGALREVREEGGVEAEILGDLGEISYFFVWEGVRVQKTVHHFLMRYLKGDPADHDFEVAEARFVPVAMARELLTYKQDKEILERAMAHPRLHEIQADAG